LTSAPPHGPFSTLPAKAILFIGYARADEPSQPKDGEVRWLNFATGRLTTAQAADALGRGPRGAQIPPPQRLLDHLAHHRPQDAIGNERAHHAVDRAGKA